MPSVSVHKPLTIANPLPRVREDSFIDAGKAKEAIAALTPERILQIDKEARQRAENLYDAMVLPITHEMVHTPFNV